MLLAIDINTGQVFWDANSEVNNKKINDRLGPYAYNLALIPNKNGKGKIIVEDARYVYCFDAIR